MAATDQPTDRSEDVTPIRVTLSAQPSFAGFPGIDMQPLTGARVMINRVVIAPGSIVPEHHHPHEQAGYVLEGILRLSAAGETWDLHPGDAYVLPGDTLHGAVPGPDGCVVLDVFSPPRQDYLEALGVRR